MKKVLSVILAALMTASMAAGLVSCNDDQGNSASTDNNTTAPAATTVKPVVTDAPDDPDDPDDSAKEDWTLMADDSYWNYMLFECPFTGEQDGTGTFPEDTDEMAKYIADHPDWMTDYETMKTWEKYQAPMGDRALALGDGNSPIGWAGDTHGILLYGSFELTAEQLQLVKESNQGDICMNMWYDNTIYIYINGELVYSNDANCAAGDWNDKQEYIDFDVDIREILKEGTNEVTVSLKDCWGGREFLMGIECIYL